MRPEPLLGVLLALLLAAVATAAPLSLRDLLPTLPPAQREQMLARASSWNALGNDGQRDYRQRLARWHALPESVRRARREQWQAWRALPPAQQARLRDVATHFATLPLAEQQQWRARYAALDASEQHGWLLGPQLGVDWMQLQPLLAQVPDDEREPLLAMLRGMDVAQRNDMAMLAQRVPPQQRDALRRTLLATSSGNRAAWLRARLQQ